MNINYYKVLGVGEQVSEEEIRRAYKRLAVMWHPDKHDSSDKHIAEIRFKEINEAYSVLSDYDKRLEYDNAGKGLDKIIFGGFDPFDIFSKVFGRRDPFFNDDLSFINHKSEFYNKFKNPDKPIKSSIKKTTQIM